MTTRMEILPKVDIVLCEGVPPAWLKHWDRTPLIVATQRARFKAPLMSVLKINHQDLGGLTTSDVCLRMMSNVSRLWDQPEVPKCLPTSVYSVASDTVDAGKRVKSPLPVRYEPPYRVRSLGTGLYHAGGLFPLTGNLERQPQFILRSVLHGGWCQRELTSAERWSVKDVPVRIHQMAIKAGVDLDEYWKRLAPGRCLQQGLRLCLQGIGVMDDAGGASKELLVHQSNRVLGDDERARESVGRKDCE